MTWEAIVAHERRERRLGTLYAMLLLLAITIVIASFAVRA